MNKRRRWKAKRRRALAAYVQRWKSDHADEIASARMRASMFAQSFGGHCEVVITIPDPHA